MLVNCSRHGQSDVGVLMFEPVHVSLSLHICIFVNEAFGATFGPRWRFRGSSVLLLSSWNFFVSFKSLLSFRTAVPGCCTEPWNPSASRDHLGDEVYKRNSEQRVQLIICSE